MKSNYLFPHRFKKIGWVILIPAAILGVIMILSDFEASFLDFRVPAVVHDEITGGRSFFQMIENNLLNEFVGICLIIGLLLVAFSKEKHEDEFISSIRLESLVWAVYVNYGILLLTLLCVYGLDYLWVVIFNMFTILVFFIIRFYWKLNQLELTAAV